MQRCKELSRIFTNFQPATIRRLAASGRYIFHWVGATTPIPERTHKADGSIRKQDFFHEVAGEEPSEKDLLEFAKSYGANDAVQECNKVVNDFVERHFQINPSENVDPDSIKISEELLVEIIRYAKLIAAGRVEVNIAQLGGEVETGAPVSQSTRLHIQVKSRQASTLWRSGVGLSGEVPWTKWGILTSPRRLVRY